VGLQKRNITLIFKPSGERLTGRYGREPHPLLPSRAHRSFKKIGQQARLRGTYEATGKLTVMFSGGIEAREFEGTDKVRNNPVFSFGLAYQPFDGTHLRIARYRNVFASNIEPGQNYTATGFEIGVEQRLVQKYTAAVTFGYENDAYFAVGDAQSTRRVDNYLYVRPRLTYNFIEWLSVSAFYEFRQTASNQVESSFYNNRVGMEIATEF
jgi:hypothetical protein